MPTVDDYDPNDDSTQGGFGPDGSSGSSSGGGQLFGGASKQHEQPYTPWSRFTSANSDVANREAGKLQSQVGGDITGAMQGLDNANAAYNKGIASQYASTPGVQAQTADTQRAQGTKQQTNAFGGASWSSFGQAAPAVGQTPPAQLARQPQANAATVASGPQGPKDLESSMTPDAWAGLTGKITNADTEATQLGKQSGVQALLSQNSGAPATGFDAALINQAGGQGFGQTAQKFGNGVLPGQQANSEQASQDAWAKLGGNVADQQAVAAGLPARQAADAKRASDITHDARLNSDRNDNTITGPSNSKIAAPSGGTASGGAKPPTISPQTQSTMDGVEKQNPGFLKSFGIDPSTDDGKSVYQALTDWFATMSQGDSKMSANNEVWFNHLSTEEKKQFVDNLRSYINSPNYDGKPFPYQIPKGSVS